MDEQHDADDEVQRAAFALIISVVDGHCSEVAHPLLCRDEDLHFALRVAHELAHLFAAGVDEADHQEMRDDLAAQLLANATEG